MLQFKVEKSMFAVVKNVRIAGGLLLYHLEMTIYQVNRQATFFKIVLFFPTRVYILHFQMYEEPHMENALNLFFSMFCILHSNISSDF